MLLNYKVVSLYSLPILSSLLLIACGGSSNAVDTSTIIQVDVSPSINQGVDLVLLNKDYELSNISWQQTAGTPVNLLASTSKVVSFTALEAGDYSFEVSYKFINGTTNILTKVISVSNDDNKVAARLSHAVRSGNKVSLRTAFTNVLDESAVVNSIKWQQESGNTVSFSEANVDGNRAIYFNAPNVSQDTLLTFNVTITDNGIDYSDKVSVLVEPSPTIASNAYFDNRVAHVFPFNSTSIYAQNIVNCVYSNTLNSSCTLATLPLIAKEAPTPSVTDIMNRVVVSHQWMGERFKDFIENNDPNDDFKHLLRATTAIVISYDIRPSFYWAATGAIYLDAENFWLTPEERDTINEAPDYRSDFGKELQFVMPWRYVKNNDYAYARFSRDERITRTEDDRLYSLASLMYHELGHANDFIASDEWFSFTDNTRLLDAATKDATESDQLAIAIPLQSNEMHDLAQVSFVGVTATTTQKSYLPNDIEHFFTPDVASDYYSYSSIREDYTMLFEELMMQSRFGVSRDIAVTNQPTTDPILATDYIVSWGQRGRIGEVNVKPRASFSALKILPEFDSISAISLLPKPILMTVGDDWIINLNISSLPKSKKLLNTQLLLRVQAKQYDMREVNTQGHYQKPLPKH